MSGIKFAPWSSTIDIPFHAALGNIKIDKDKLDDSARKVLGLYEVKPNERPENSARMQIHGTALTSDGCVHP